MSKSIIIIGGGIAGLSAAYALIKDGWQITLVRKDVEHSASWNSAGRLTMEVGAQQLRALEPSPPPQSTHPASPFPQSIPQAPSPSMQAHHPCNSHSANSHDPFSQCAPYRRFMFHSLALMPAWLRELSNVVPRKLDDASSHELDETSLLERRDTWMLTTHAETPKTRSTLIRRGEREGFTVPPLSPLPKKAQARLAKSFCAELPTTDDDKIDNPNKKNILKKNIPSGTFFPFSWQVDPRQLLANLETQLRASGQVEFVEGSTHAWEIFPPTAENPVVVDITLPKKQPTQRRLTAQKLLIAAGEATREILQQEKPAPQFELRSISRIAHGLRLRHHIPTLPETNTHTDALTSPPANFNSNANPNANANTNANTNADINSSSHAPQKSSSSASAPSPYLSWTHARQTYFIERENNELLIGGVEQKDCEAPASIFREELLARYINFFSTPADIPASIPEDIPADTLARVTPPQFPQFPQLLEHFQGVRARSRDRLPLIGGLDSTMIITPTSTTPIPTTTATTMPTPPLTSTVTMAVTTPATTADLSKLTIPTNPPPKGQNTNNPSSPKKILPGTLFISALYHKNGFSLAPLAANLIAAHIKASLAPIASVASMEKNTAPSLITPLGELSAEFLSAFSPNRKGIFATPPSQELPTFQ